MRLSWLPLFPLLLALSLPSPLQAAADPDDPEGIGSEMGYRMFGKARKNAPLLLQNSRPFPVEVFEERQGVYVRIPSYSDRDFPCRGKARLLHVRYIDQFGESAPFQLRIGCGRELQFIAKRQLVTPATGAAIPAGAGATVNPAAPAAAAPAEQTPAEQTPAEQTPAEQTPAEQAPSTAEPAPAASEPPPFLSPVN